MIGTRLATRAIDLVTMTILARNLRPTDFGVVAVALTIILVIEAVLELPLNQALLRLPSISDSQYDTAFTLSALRGLSIGLIVVLLAHPFAAFYNDARLVPLVCVLSIAPAARGLQSPRLAAYQKRMSYWRDTVIELGGKLVGFTVSVLMAIWTKSYWSMALGIAVYPLAMAVLSYIFAPHRPRLTLIDFPVFSGFLGWMTVAQFIGAINFQADRLVLGKLTTPAELGLFSAGNDLSNIPILALFGPLLRPLLSAFAVIRHEPAELARSYQVATSAIFMIGLPLLVLESLFAEPIVRLILGGQWLGVAPLLKWLALSLIPLLLGISVGPLAMCLGQTKIFFQTNGIDLLIKLPLMVVGALKYGFLGAIAARFVSAVALAVFSVIIVRRLIGATVSEQLFWFWRSVVGVMAMACAVVLCERPVVGFSGTVDLILQLLIGVTIGGFVYCSVMWGLWAICGRSPRSIESVIANEFGRLMKVRSN